ncbi:hypothetical protein CAL26_00895 [Bordetella genomosp. 9]|uniref:Uncharacterized protein n=1 Tax=Bordetella genomosp. 9 TaxID=1416803 RepID=A0A261RLL4_9BORD|nr:hypothetical protein [Bordetella genomosp. 9]OZI25946.1 hypothetical protein CAL26_00895 [Bordetella genomosp. 9]
MWILFLRDTADVANESPVRDGGADHGNRAGDARLAAGAALTLVFIVVHAWAWLAGRPVLGENRSGAARVRDGGLGKRAAGEPAAGLANSTELIGMTAFWLFCLAE